MKKLFKNTVLLAIFQIALTTSKAMPQGDSAILEKKIDKVTAKVDTSYKSLDSSIKAVAKTIATANAKKDSARKSDSSSLFNAWKYAQKHPEELYKKPCENCDNPWILEVLAFLIMAAFLFYAFKYFLSTALCRDESYFLDKTDNVLKLRPEKDRPFSYSRVQMFWWTIIIFACYAFFFAMYGKLIPLSPTCIILLGGGLATQILGKTIDNSQIESDRNKVNDSKADANSSLASRHQDLHKTQGIWIDILSDENGVSIHRLQSVAFNIIYGVGFIAYFMTSIDCKQYPFIEFEGWQLMLLGISTAGYLGLKTNENSKASESDRKDQAANPAEVDKPQPTNADLKNPVKTDTTEPITPPRDETNYQ